MLILLSNSSSCLLDPVLTWLLKKCIADVLPLVTVIMNKSVTSGKSPESLENAIVKPHVNIEKLHSQELKDYRLILIFYKKIIEKCVVKQPEEFMHDNIGDWTVTSARCWHHSACQLHLTLLTMLSSSGDCTIYTESNSWPSNGSHHTSPIEHIKSASIHGNPSLYYVVCLKAPYLALDYIVCSFIYYP